MTPPLRIMRTVGRVRRRIRLQRAVNLAATFGLVGLGVASVVLTLVKTSVVDEGAATQWLVGAAALPLLGALLGALRRVPALLPAQLLDRSHDLRSRLASAIDFTALEGEQRTPFMDAAIADAEARADGLVPKRAMPLTMPRDLAPAIGLALAVATLASLEVPERASVRVEPQLSPLLMYEDDLEGFEAGIQPLLADAETSEEVREVAQALNQVLEDLVDRRLERAEALRELAELENRLAEGRPADAEAMREALREIGRDLDRASLTKAASEAMRQADAERASQEMSSLAETLRTESPSRRELERLRQALERAANHEPQDRSEELERRREEMESLLRRQREEQQLSQREERLLRRRRRQLERLERDQQQAQEQRRQLERLRREMRQAAEQLNRRERQQASESLRRTAEELNRMGRQQMSEQQRQQLSRQLRQLRELLRRQRQAGNQGNQGKQGQGQGGQGQRMKRFVLRAQGQGQEGQGTPIMMPGGQGQQGQGQQGQGQQGQGQQGQGQGGQGQGQQGQGQGQGQQVLMMGQGGEGNATLEMPGAGGQEEGQGGEGQGGGQGPGAGDSHSDSTAEATDIRSRTQNTRVEGQQSGGPSRSEVILSAADQGFVGSGYQDVHSDYSTHAEEVLERDDIPPGYRFYVRRYFQLIRPREEPAQ